MDILNDELLYTENLSKNFQGITAVDKGNFKINKKLFTSFCTFSSSLDSLQTSNKAREYLSEVSVEKDLFELIFSC